MDTYIPVNHRIIKSGGWALTRRWALTREITVTHLPGGLIVDIVTSDEGLDEHSGQYMNLVSTVC